MDTPVSPDELPRVPTHSFARAVKEAHISHMLEAPSNKLKPDSRKRRSSWQFSLDLASIVVQAGPVPGSPMLEAGRRDLRQQIGSSDQYLTWSSRLHYNALSKLEVDTMSIMEGRQQATCARVASHIRSSRTPDIAPVRWFNGSVRPTSISFLPCVERISM